MKELLVDSLVRDFRSCESALKECLSSQGKVDLIWEYVQKFLGQKGAMASFITILNNELNQQEDPFGSIFSKEQVSIKELSSISKQFKYFTLLIIVYLIKSFLSFIDRKRTMDDAQIYETAALLCSEYRFLTIADVIMFFRMLKLGKFGEIFDLNGTTILRFVMEYRRIRNSKLNEYYKDLEHKKNFQQ